MKKDNFNKVILASASPRRRSILNEIGIDFKIYPPKDVKELGKEYYYPDHVSVINAITKTENISNLYPNNLVIGADTVVMLNGEIIGKPSDSEDAKNILRNLSGKTHTVVTSVVIRHVRTNLRCIFSDISEVTFFPLNDSLISKYIQKVNVLDKAGAYAVQNHGSMIIKEIKGSVYNVMGLPKEKLMEALRIYGFKI